MIVIGIDPGTPLTVAAICGDRILGVWDKEALGTQEQRAGRKGKTWQNDPHLLRGVLAPFAMALRARVVIERVAPMPSQGISSSVRFVGSMYLAHGVAVGLGLHVDTVTPSVWKRDMGLNSDKEKSRAMALQRWPSETDRFKRMMDHDRAEAALLAAWWLDHKYG